MGDAVTNSGKKGWLVAILELGAWVGVLMTGYFADKLSRKYTILLGMSPCMTIRTHFDSLSLAVIVFCIGVIVQTTAKGPPNIFGGRFVTGLGVGSLSMAVPLYNAEVSQVPVLPLILKISSSSRRPKSEEVLLLFSSSPSRSGL